MTNTGSSNTLTTSEVTDVLQQRIQASIAVKTALLDELALCTQVAERLIAAYQAGNKAILFGNGGSAADAQHIAAEFVGRYYIDRRPLPALALSVNNAIITAIGNDYSYDEIFSRQIMALGNPGDVAIGLSTSGDSPNVLEGLRVARERGLVTVGLTGANGGRMRDAADYCLCVPTTDTPRIQEGYMLISHIWCELVEQALFGANRG